MLAVCTGAVPVQNPGAAVYTDLNGKVTDAATGEAVPFATVFLKGSERGVLTEDDGRYRIQTAHRFDSIMVSAMGYETIAVPAGK
ncbi:MAG: carboxypeptidase-like regulatory domain-containing protein, partial [Duncaniella sp.]|nr:carboxypeptidase-like regulatory domain-containing protein [Duncaniella sp.]